VHCAVFKKNNDDDICMKPPYLVSTYKYYINIFLELLFKYVIIFENKKSHINKI